jgi:solute carrier family 6 noradrenalin transporter-like protein 2
LVTVVVNSFTSFFSGFVIFTYLGYMAHAQKKDIDKVATEGPGLVFEVYPQAVATLPGSQFWAVIFFFMLIMLGMDSAMGGLECVITGIMDEFRDFFHRYKITREIFTGVVVSFSFLVAISCVTPGGFYIFTLLNEYAAGLSLLCTVFFEAIAISWFYGLNNFSSDIQEMLGHKPGIYWRFCWKFVSPLFLAFIIGMQMVDIRQLTMDRYDGEVYHYPAAAQWAGRLLAASTVACIPIAACIVFINASRAGPSGKTKSCIESLAIAITPANETRTDEQYSRLTLAHWRQL